MSYNTRPLSKNRGARVAWDRLAEEAADMTPPATIKMLWFAREMEAWCAHLSNDDYIEVDMLVVHDRVNNPHKYI